MSNIKRNILAGVVTIWLGVAFLVGLAFGQAMPAMNWFGRAYVGLTWPVALGCHAARDICTTVPPDSIGKHMFTFDDGPKK